MKIGLIVFSHTGHCLSLAETLEAALRAAGHDAQTLRVTVAAEDPTKGGAPLKDTPDPAPFDDVVFLSPVWALPVWAFSLPDVMARYMAQTPSLAGKRAACVVTQSMSRAIFGGGHTARQLARAATQKGARVVLRGVIGWKRPDRDEHIRLLSGELVRALS